MAKREILEERIKEYKSIINWVREDGDEYEEIPMYEQMIKEAQKELNDKKRGTWGNTNPVTRVQPNKKAYDRKRDKKARK